LHSLFNLSLFERKIIRKWKMKTERNRSLENALFVLSAPKKMI
jgi:hypothetical protein